MKEKQNATIFLACIGIILGAINYQDNRSQDTLLFKTIDEAQTNASQLHETLLLVKDNTESITVIDEAVIKLLKKN